MSNVQRWNRVGVLAAISLLLAYAETFVPIPIPGVKLGLANVGVLIALDFDDAAGAFCVAVIKILAVGMLFGSPLTMVYSLTGTLLSFAGMAPLSKLRTMRIEMVSVVGALLHEVGQLFVASIVLGTTSVWQALPVLLVAGCITGALCGVLARRLAKGFPQDEEWSSLGAAQPTAPAQPNRHTLLAFCALVAYAVIVFHLFELPALVVAMLVVLAACKVSHVDMRRLLRMVPAFVMLTLCTLGLQLLVDTRTATQETARAMLRLACLACASRAFMQAIPTDDLTGTIAWMVLPLNRLGISTQGFVHAFGIAVRLIPSIADSVREEADSYSGRLSIRQLWQVLPDLMRGVIQKLV